VLSAVKSIGLHWLFAFMPPLFMAAAFVLGPDRLAASAKFLAAFSAVHLLVVAVVAALPLETWQRSRHYDSLVMAFHPDEVLAALKPYEGRYVFAASSYSAAVLLSYHAAERGFVAQAGVADGAQARWRTHYFPTFGPGSAHGRHDDILTDFRELDGKDILVVRKTAADPDEYRPYFRAIEMREIAIRGTKYFLVLGQGFDYAAYRDRVLVEVRDRYYRIPRYLPQGRCYLCERYWASATCPAP
jgi:hypothetical protein